jgi:hypothetical protein
MSVDEKKRFENLEKKRFENLDENFNDDLENDLKNANFMNTKFVNLHVIFFFDLILNYFTNKHLKSRLNITHFFRNFDLSDEEIENDVDEKNEKNLRARFLIDDITIFCLRSFISSYSSRSTSH